MATFIELDSGLRNREFFANPAEFTVTKEQVNGWFRKSRTVRAYPAPQHFKPLEFATSVELRDLTTPYLAALADVPRIYVDFHSQTYNDQYLISSINGVNRDAKFVLTFDRIVNNDAGVRTWIHWINIHREQVMRFKRDEPVFFRVFTRDGITLAIVDAALPAAINPLVQVFASFDIRPYIIDAGYDSQFHETAT